MAQKRKMRKRMLKRALWQSLSLLFFGFRYLVGQVFVHDFLDHPEVCYARLEQYQKAVAYLLELQKSCNFRQIIFRQIITVFLLALLFTAPKF